MIDTIVSGGTVTLIALAVLAGELVLLVALRRGALAITLANILSGGFLILALRAALLDQPPAMVALWLGLGFLAHIADLFGRLR